MPPAARAVRIKLQRKDTLARHGYRDVKDLSVDERRVALAAAIVDYGPTYVIRKLNVLAIYNKNKRPALAAKFRADMKFVQGVRDVMKGLNSTR